MDREEFRKLYIFGKDVNRLSDAIPGEVIKFVLWRGFSGTKQSYSWQVSHEEMPLFQLFGTKHIPIVDFAFQTSLKLKISQSQPEDIDCFTIQDLPDGSLILDESLVQYSEGGQNIFKGFYLVFSQSIRNSIAHGIFGICDDSALFCDGRDSIMFVLKIKKTAISSLFNKWWRFSSRLLDLRDTSAVIVECLHQIGYNSTAFEDCVILRDEKKPDWSICLPAQSLQAFGNEKERRAQAKSLMERRCHSLVVFPTVHKTEPIGRNYLFIDEWYTLAKSKKTPRAFLNILRRVGYEK